MHWMLVISFMMTPPNVPAKDVAFQYKSAELCERGRNNINDLLYKFVLDSDDVSQVHVSHCKLI